MNAIVLSVVRSTRGRLLLGARLALFLSLGAGVLPAQTTPADPAADVDDSEPIRLNSYVVTGSVTPRRQLETPLAITTIGASAIERAAPRSTAELLKIVPGLYIESTGGEANNNVFPRGVFSSGGYRYTALQEDGLPVVSESELSFNSADNYTRISNCVSTVEGLRGGSSGVFQTNAVISTVNFIGREGTSAQHGEIKLEVGDYGLIRNDLWVSGPLGANTTYAIGGFYRVSDGVRDPGYTADRGGQLVANVRHAFASGRGHVKVSGKLLNDRTAFLLPIPLTGTAKKPRSIPGGPDLLEGASSSPDIRRFQFPGTPAGDLDWDLADGIHVNLGYLGSELSFALWDGLKVENRNRYTRVEKSWNANPFNNAQPLQAIADTLATSANTTPDQFAAALQADGHYRFMLTGPGSGNATVAADPAAAAGLNGNGLGVLDGYWHSASDIDNFQNDFRVIHTFNEESSNVTAGVYYAWFQNERFWQWNQQLLDVSPSYRRLDLVYLDAATGAPIGQYTSNGITQLGSLYTHDEAEQNDVSVYLNAQHKLAALTLDAGWRYTWLSYDWRAEGTQAFDLNPAGETTPALRNATFGSGAFTSGSPSSSAGAMTVGANYEFTRTLAAFARYSYGPRMKTTDDSIGAQNDTALGPTEKISQYEVGLKFAGRRAGVFLTAFEMQQDNLLQQDFVFGPDGTPIRQTAQLDVRTPGIELEGMWTPLSGLTVDVRGVWQDPEMSTPLRAQNPANPADFIPLEGKRPYRLPTLYGTVGAAYSLPSMSWGTITVNASYQYTGSRYVDLANQIKLSSFDEVFAGVSVALKNGFTFRVQAANLFNSKGITEGDPRSDQIVATTASYFNARPLLPRSIIASATYSF